MIIIICGCEGGYRHGHPLRAGRGGAAGGGSAGAGLARPPAARPPAAAAAPRPGLGGARVRAVAGGEGPRPGGPGHRQERGGGEQEAAARPPAGRECRGRGGRGVGGGDCLAGGPVQARAHAGQDSQHVLPGSVQNTVTVRVDSK